MNSKIFKILLVIYFVSFIVIITVCHLKTSNLMTIKWPSMTT